ncbi:MAG: nitroreductase [Bacteroidales bacterium]|nr:nitroreductase [Bacteroidales bacterium]
MKNFGKLALVAIIPMMMACCGGNQTASNESAEDQVIETIMARRSIRAYKDQPVEREKVQKILECGINAANAINKQAWEIRVVDNPEWIAGVSELFVKANPKMGEDPNFKNMFRNAPTVIFVANEVDFKYSPVDCGLLGGNIVTAAQAMGLGTCIMGGPIGFFYTPEAAEYLAALNIPEGYQLLYCVALGYPDESPEAKPRNPEKIQYID